jgi:c-di-GMP-binding flagellar brake protein YcgR
VRVEAGYEDQERQVFFSTRDVSEGGVYLHAAEPPERGQEARITLELPECQELLRIGGVVVRTDGEAGFALRFDRRAMSELARNQLREFIDRTHSASL